MKRASKIVVVVFISCLSIAWVAHAVSWSPLEEKREEKAAKGIKVAGDIVCLFQSGTAEVKKIIHIGDVLPVYREDREHQARPVGKIRILSYVGEDYLQAEVVEGKLMTGDIAKKDDVASLLPSSEDKCKERKK